MKRKILNGAIVLVCSLLFACSDKKDAASIAKKWCDLNGKVAKAEGDAKEAARKALNDYENEMEAKYKNDDAFMKEIEREAEKCEAASEGR